MAPAAEHCAWKRPSATGWMLPVVSAAKDSMEPCSDWHDCRQPMRSLADAYGPVELACCGHWNMMFMPLASSTEQEASV